MTCHSDKSIQRTLCKMHRPALKLFTAASLLLETCMLVPTSSWMLCRSVVERTKQPGTCLKRNSASPRLLWTYVSVLRWSCHRPTVPRRSSSLSLEGWWADNCRAALFVIRWHRVITLAGVSQKPAAEENIAISFSLLLSRPLKNRF